MTKSNFKKMTDAIRLNETRYIVDCDSALIRSLKLNEKLNVDVPFKDDIITSLVYTRQGIYYFTKKGLSHTLVSLPMQTIVAIMEKINRLNK